MTLQSWLQGALFNVLAYNDGFVYQVNGFLKHLLLLFLHHLSKKEKAAVPGYDQRPPCCIKDFRFPVD